MKSTNTPRKDGKSKQTESCKDFAYVRMYFFCGQYCAILFLIIIL